MIGDLAVARLSPVVISSVVATVVSRHHLGDFPAFEVPVYQLVHSRELLLYAGLGVVAALVGVVFIRILFRIGDAFERSKIPRWLQPAVGGLAVGVIALVFPHVYGVGYETINGALWGQVGGWALAGLVGAKLLATSMTLGSGGSGGVFAPSLFLGAVLGAAFGHLVHGWFPAWTATAGAYALVGMGALVAATTRAPITAILIIFELTNDYHIIPPLMLSCVIGVLLGSLLSRESIYTAKLVRRGVNLSDGKDVNLLRGILVGDVMRRDPITVDAGLSFGQLLPRLLGAHHTELMVVGEDRRLLGTIDLADIRAAVPDSEDLAALVVAADVMDTQSPVALASDRLDMLMHRFERSHREEIPVIDDGSHRRLIGVVMLDDVVKAYNRQSFQLDQTGSFQTMTAAAREGQMVELMGGVYLAEVEVPSRLVGMTLSQASLRQRHGLEVVLIRKAAEEGEAACRFPAPTSCLEAGDRVLVMGPSEAIRALSE